VVHLLASGGGQFDLEMLAQFGDVEGHVDAEVAHQVAADGKAHEPASHGRQVAHRHLATDFERFRQGAGHIGLPSAQDLDHRLLDEAFHLRGGDRLPPHPLHPGVADRIAGAEHGHHAVDARKPGIACLEFAAHPLAEAAESLGAQRIGRGEMVVDLPRRSADPRRHRPHRRCRKPFLAHQGKGGFDDLSTALVLGKITHFGPLAEILGGSQEM
jgi:HPt (histidine-containing phosphotransfer) domain-containing protein